MKVRKHPRSVDYLKLAVAAAIADLLFNPLAAHAQGTSGTFSNVTVTGTTGTVLSVTGSNSAIDFGPNSLSFGTVTSGTNKGQAGVSALFTTGTPSTFSLVATGTSQQWWWERAATSGTTTTTVPMMMLSSTNGLTIYNASGTPAFALNPAATSGSNSVLTQQAGDGRYVSSAAISASGNNLAFARGTASGHYSFAGFGGTATGWWSTASGNLSTASGRYSTASGYAVTASGYAQFAVGRYNIPQGSPNSWVPTDDLFIVGNGSIADINGHGTILASDAFVVKKNGNTTVFGTLTANSFVGPPSGNIQTPRAAVPTPVPEPPIRPPAGIGQPPSGHIQTPLAAVPTPAQALHIQPPAGIVHKPSGHIQTPREAVLTPAPALQMQTPAAVTRTPVAAIQPPADRIHRPMGHFQTPAAPTLAPVVRDQPPAAITRQPWRMDNMSLACLTVRFPIPIPVIGLQRMNYSPSEMGLRITKLPTPWSCSRAATPP
jgi:hypothetical protein